MELTLIKQLNGDFRPATDKDKKLCNKVKVGSPISGNFTKPRNYEFHKKYFALLNLAFEYSDINNFEFFRKEIIKRAGYYESYINFKGIEVFEAKSISFAKMDNLEFEILFKKTIDVILKYVLKNNTEEEILENLINFI